MQAFAIAVLTVLLAACSQRYMVSDDLSYAYNLPPVGSRLVLKRPLEMPAGEARLFLQNGAAMKKSEFDRYKPNCSLEVRTLSERPKTIEPDSFLVTEVQRITEQVVNRTLPESGFIKAAFDDGGKPMVTRGYHLWLGSDRQPDVMRMTCRGAFDDLNRADPPSLDEVRQSLGDYADLMLPI